MVRVKICGITRPEDAEVALRAGADALGFVFSRKSPRYISPSRAMKISEKLPPFVSKVGVFVNEKTGAIRDIAGFCGLDAVQLHGEEDPHFCHRLKRYGFKIVKAFRVGPDFNITVPESYRVDAYLFDACVEGQPGGTGKTFAWDMLKGMKYRVPVILSGGLTPQNVREGIAALHPYAVDVSSGVESAPGAKDPARLQAFLAAVRDAG